MAAVDRRRLSQFNPPGLLSFGAVLGFRDPPSGAVRGGMARRPPSRGRALGGLSRVREVRGRRGKGGGRVGVPVRKLRAVRSQG